MFHDHHHGAIFSDSKVGGWLMSAIGVFILIPSRAWHETHNFHHWHNGKLEWTSIGSYPIMTTEELATAPTDKRRKYLRKRHVLAIFGGYLSVGIKGMCLDAFRRNPRRHWAGPLALALHMLVFVGLVWQLDLLTALLAWSTPIVVLRPA